MDCFEFVIAGSGPAGIAAARRLQGEGTCIVDIGAEAAADFPFGNLRDALATGQVREILGQDWEMLSNLSNPLNCHPKLRARGVRHVMAGEPYDVRDDGGDLLVSGQGSGAAGGMANAWGAQLMRYTEADLAPLGDWPIAAADLVPYYADLEQHIGLSGELDDMSSFLGPVDELMPPVPMVPAAACLLRKYLSRSNARRRDVLRLGRPRLGVLTRAHRGREAYSFGETEFFSCAHPGIYSPKQTLSELVARDRVAYVPAQRLIGYTEHPDHVELSLEQVGTGVLRRLKARHLLVGCGTIQTARLLLSVRGEPGRSLPFIDHPPTLLPLFIPSVFGCPIPDRTFPVQLVATLEGFVERDMISFYYPGGLLWSDLLLDIPLPIDVARKVFGAVLGGMLVAQVWEFSRPCTGNRLSLAAGGRVRVDYTRQRPYPRLATLLSSLRRFGCLSHSRLASMPPPSWGFHHAGTVPMRKNPGVFETHADGRLWDSSRIRVIDGSVFPSLPSKNLALTIMANAARIADLVKSCGY